MNRTNEENIQFIMDCYIDCPRDVQLAWRNATKNILIKKGWLPETAEKWANDNRPVWDMEKFNEKIYRIS